MPHDVVVRRQVFGWLNRLAIGFLIFAIMIFAGLWLSIGHQIERDRQDAIEDVIRQNMNLARVFEEHTIQTLNAMDGIVIGLVRRFEAEGEVFDLPALWASLPINADLIISAIITDSAGMVILGSTPPPRISLADREPINTHFAADSGQLFIGKPIEGRISGQWSMPLTRRISNPDGSLKGVAGLTVNPLNFSRLYEDVDLGRDSLVGLVGLDGIGRARLVAGPVDLTVDLSKSDLLRQVASAPQGSYVATTVYDGIIRIFSYRKVRGYPLVVSVGVAMDTALAAVDKEARYERGFMVMASIAILTFAMVLIAFAVRARRSFQAAEAAGQQLRDVTDHLPGLIGYLDMGRRLRFINKTGEQWYAAPAKDIIGKTVSEMERRPDTLDVNTLSEHLLAGPLRRDTTRSYPDGKTRTVDTIIVPDKGPDGRLRGYYRLSMDVTERNRLEEQLRELQKIETIGLLTGGIAHDFNNLLMVIIGNLEMASLSGELSPKLSTMVETAQRAAMRGADLTKQLLSYARRQILSPELTDLNEKISEIGAMLRRIIPASIAIDLRCHPIPVMTLVDAGQLDNALLNLALNARDAMKTGGSIKISTGIDDIKSDDGTGPEVVPAGCYGVIEVRDSGTGMTPEVLAQAFEPFFTTKPMGHGTGLGLSMVYGFVRQSGGYLRISSIPGQGTTVRLLFPLSEERVPKSAMPISISSRDRHTAITRRLILAVEDMPDTMTTVTSMLGDLGYDCVTAVDGPSALRVLSESGVIDGMLTDNGLPGEWSGLDLAELAV